MRCKESTSRKIVSYYQVPFLILSSQRERWKESILRKESYISKSYSPFSVLKKRDTKRVLKGKSLVLASHILHSQFSRRKWDAKRVLPEKESYISKSYSLFSVLKERDAKKVLLGKESYIRKSYSPFSVCKEKIKS